MSTPGYKTPGEELFEKVLGMFGAGPASIAKQLYEKFAPPGGATGGKFSVDLADLKNIHKEFEKERDGFDKIRIKNEQIVERLEPMAEDPVSTSHVQKAKEHYGTTFAEAIEKQFEYCDAYCLAIEKAIETYEKGDSAAAEDSRNQRQGV